MYCRTRAQGQVGTEVEGTGTSQEGGGTQEGNLRDDGIGGMLAITPPILTAS